MRLILLTCLLSTASFADYHRLHSSAATSSTFLKSNWNKYEENYHPNYALDDDPKTAWVEGADGDGLGEWITVPVSPLKSARALRLVVLNGYQKSKVLLEANAAPREITVRVTGPSGKQSALQKFPLEKAMGPQSLELALAHGIAEVTVKVEAVHPGKKYKDTVISDLQVWVDSDVPYLKAVEEGKQKALLAWRKERLAAAKYFSSLPKEYIYATGQFSAAPSEQTLVGKRWASVVEHKDKLPTGVPAKGYVGLDAQLGAGKVPGGYGPEDRKLILELDALRRTFATQKDARFYRLETKPRTRHTPPDGAPLPHALSAVVNLGEQTLFETSGIGNLTPVIKAEREADSSHGEVLSNLLLLEGTPAEPTKVFFLFTEVSADRSVTTQTTWFLAELAGGRLQRLAARQQSDSDFENHVQVSLTRVKWTAAKVSGFERKMITETEASLDGPDLQSDGLYVETAIIEAIPST